MEFVVDLGGGTGDSADSSGNELRSVLAGNQEDALVRVKTRRALVSCTSPKSSSSDELAF